jgi:hypothetical protein
MSEVIDNAGVQRAPRIPHPFFDPLSRYNRLRATATPEARVWAYFSPPSQAVVEPDKQVRGDHESWEAPMQMAASSDSDAARERWLAIRLEGLNEVREVRAEFAVPESLRPPFFIKVKLLNSEDHPKDKPALARLLILDQRPLDNLRSWCREERKQVPEKDRDLILQALSEAMLDGTMAVPAIFSGLPDIVGQMKTDGTVRFEATLPCNARAIAKDAWLLCVYSADN